MEALRYHSPGEPFIDLKCNTSDHSACHLQVGLGLHPHQLATARELWEGFAADMAELRASREQAIQVLHDEDEEYAASQRPAYSLSANTMQLLENVAELRRNAAMQQELLAHMHRAFLLSTLR